MDELEPDVLRQTAVTLPFLDDEVPALYLPDGRPYIPVFAVCHALGIPLPAPSGAGGTWRCGSPRASCRSRPGDKASAWSGVC